MKLIVTLKDSNFFVSRLERGISEGIESYELSEEEKKAIAKYIDDYGILQISIEPKTGTGKLVKVEKQI